MDLIGNTEKKPKFIDFSKIGDAGNIQLKYSFKKKSKSIMYLLCERKRIVTRLQKLAEFDDNLRSINPRSGNPLVTVANFLNRLLDGLYCLFDIIIDNH